MTILSSLFLRILSVHRPPNQETRHGKRKRDICETFLLIRKPFEGGGAISSNTHTKVGIAKFFPHLTLTISRVKPERKEMFFGFGEVGCSIVLPPRAARQERKIVLLLRRQKGVCYPGGIEWSVPRQQFWALKLFGVVLSHSERCPQVSGDIPRTHVSIQQSLSLENFSPLFLHREASILRCMEC